MAWPTLTDDKSDARDVVMFYEELEDVCARQGAAVGAQGPVSRFEVENLYERVPRRVEKRRSPQRPTPESRRNTLSSGKAVKRGRSESTASMPRWPSSNLSSRRRSQSWRRSA